MLLLSFASVLVMYYGRKGMSVVFYTGVPFWSKVAPIKRVRVWILGQSIPIQNSFKYPGVLRGIGSSGDEFRRKRLKRHRKLMSNVFELVSNIRAQNRKQKMYSLCAWIFAECSWFQISAWWPLVWFLFIRKGYHKCSVRSFLLLEKLTI